MASYYRNQMKNQCWEGRKENFNQYGHFGKRDDPKYVNPSLGVLTPVLGLNRGRIGARGKRLM
jgi:hypothetical protein